MDEDQRLISTDRVLFFRCLVKRRRRTAKKPPPKGDGFFGDPTGTRTPDPLLKRQLLYRLSYRIRPYSVRIGLRMVWLGRLDSNQRVRESKSLALPLGDAPME